MLKTTYRERRKNAVFKYGILQDINIVMHFKVSMKDNILYLIRKYSTFSTLVLSTIIVANVYSAYVTFTSDRSIFDVAEKALVGVFIVVCASLVSLLPYDLYKVNKDKKMCRSLNLDYRSFAVKTEEQKDEIREKFSKHA
ncbi:hypothetical protein [Paraglaciecola chathamensis]|uniref:hypothetical protein n=1 Tax=Paraglaciecola chathamensis TaxID=368405 RepID=UPI00129BC79E|nr:hypothetical protein [Paraglaciecola chathamensis]